MLDETRQHALGRFAVLATLLPCAIALVAPAPVQAQGLTVSPVRIELAPGELAAALTVDNQSSREIAFQIRGFSWDQSGTGDEQLVRTDALEVSPPLGTIAPGAIQVVRLVLRAPPQGHEGTYRILFDELAPPAEPGIVHIVVRFSIPVFAEPDSRVASRLSWRIANRGKDSWLLARNDGTAHEVVSGIALSAPDGRTFRVSSDGPPYVLANGAHGWRIEARGSPLAPGTALRLTASAARGAIDENVRVDAGP